MIRIPYLQQAEPWLKKLASRWSMSRDATVGEIGAILTSAQEILETEEAVHKKTRERLADEQNAHSHTMAKMVGAASRLDLISKMLGAKSSEHPKCEEFHAFLGRFVEFANGVKQCGHVANAMSRLQGVEAELRLLGRVPLFREKTVIAVAGGFSSGKSSLITSFFDEKHRVALPIGVDPVTAVPTYIACGEQTSIIGFPTHGGSFPIAPELFAQMRHEFISSLGFDIRRFLPFIVLETPWRERRQHVCLIDTPGYNAPAMGDRATAADDRTTIEALQQADALLWVIGLDANGEISADDLEFIQNNACDLPLAVVVNKADQRPPGQVHSVVEQIQATLDAYAITYRCISAYSSREGVEYEYIGCSLNEFIESMNKRSAQREERLRDVALEIIDGYIKVFDDEILVRAKLKKEIHSLGLDLEELGLSNEA